MKKFMNQEKKDTYLLSKSCRFYLSNNDNQNGLNWTVSFFALIERFFERSKLFDKLCEKAKENVKKQISYRMEVFQEIYFEVRSWKY